MSMTVKLLSSLEKVRSMKDLETPELTEVRLFRGEHFAFQVGCYSEVTSFLSISAEVKPEREMNPAGNAAETSTELSFAIYKVQAVSMDLPAYADHDEDILTDVPGPMPDLLTPAEEGWSMKVCDNIPAGAYWLDTVVPKDLIPGTYTVTITLDVATSWQEAPERIVKELRVTVLSDVLPEQSVLFTEWFHVDCIAERFHTGVYTEAHWNMIEKYMRAAVCNGINMILVPAFTPPLDTMPGTHRLMTQLVGIEKAGENYRFDFAKMDRYMDLALSCGLSYFEISHLFSQWGAKYAPNIEVTENGEKTMMFGWHVESTSPEYRAFLEQFLNALTSHLEARGLLEKCWFHISDEPGTDALEMYRTLQKFVKPLLKGRPIMDALSNVEFSKEDLIDCPVTATNHIEPFLEEGYENQWAYVCCGQYKKVGNRFLGMPQYRNRIIGIQLFKFDIKGFLQWGFNFYRSQLSVYEIDPYVSTSADGSFPSGDAFIVYPGADGPLNSMRGLVFRDALQDVDILKLASEKLGREYVLRVIDEEAGCEVRFDTYPRESGYILRLMERLKKEIYNKVDLNDK